MPLSNYAFGVEVNRLVTISNLHPMSIARTGANGKSITRVFVNSAAWGTTTCRTDAADLNNDDTHISSILLAAWMSDKKLTIYVEDTQRPIDNVCRITALVVQ